MERPFEWASVFSYAGLAFAVIYRIPQVVKLVRTRSGGDLSVATFMIQCVRHSPTHPLCAQRARGGVGRAGLMPFACLPSLRSNGAYVSFILYLWGSAKNEPVLAFYYSMGIAQNLLIYFLKSYCKGHFTASPARHFSIYCLPSAAAALRPCTVTFSVVFGWLLCAR